VAELRHHPAEQHLTDLALSDVEESECASLSRHLAACPECRAEYEGIRDVIAHVSAAAPVARVPAPFTDRVLAAIADEREARDEALGGGEAGGPVRGMTTRRRRAEYGVEAGRRVREMTSRRRRAWYGVAAAVAVGLAVGAGSAVVVLDRDEASQEVAAVGTAFLTRDGTRVGTLLDSRFDGRPVLVMTLTGGVVGARYDCELVLADGRREPAGSWVLRESAGATWVVPRPGGDEVIRVELLRDGSTWATATL
jgi:hypothetical protein